MNAICYTSYSANDIIVCGDFNNKIICCAKRLQLTCTVGVMSSYWSDGDDYDDDIDVIYRRLRYYDFEQDQEIAIYQSK